MSGREVHGLHDTFIEGPGSYDGGRWVVVIRGEHVSTHPTRKAAREDMRARKDWCPAAPGPICSRKQAVGDALMDAMVARGFTIMELS